MTRLLRTDWQRLRLKTLQRDLRAAVRANSAKDASAACTKMGLSHLLLSAFPENHLRLICSLIGTKDFASSPEAAGSILAFLMTESHKLTSRQKRRLLGEFECLYPKVTQRAWDICFKISELVGSDFRDEAALEMLLRLLDVPRPRIRASVAHGLEHIVCDSHNPNLTSKALQALRRMATDPAENVRIQVEESLATVERSEGRDSPNANLQQT